MITILEWLKDWLRIYTWKELWLVASVPVIISMFWLTFSFLLSIRNDIIRAVGVWSLFILVTNFAAIVGYLREHRQSK